MKYRPLTTGNSLGANFSQINAMAKELNKRERVEIFKDDSGTRRVLLGKGLNGFYGLKVSKEGKDVYEASDSELVFNSSQNVFKIITTDTAILLGTAAGAGTSSVDVDLGSVTETPIVFAYALVASLYVPLPFESQGLSGGDIVTRWGISYHILGANLTFNYIQDSTQGDTTAGFSIKYYVLQETAS